MKHRLTAIWCICYANMMLLHCVSQWSDVCHKMWRSHTSLGEADIISNANIICRRQTSLKKTLAFASAFFCVWSSKWQLTKSRRRHVWNQTEGLDGIITKWCMASIRRKDTLRRVMPYADGDYILAHARFHTNPSDWIEKRPSKTVFFLAPPAGLEPATRWCS